MILQALAEYYDRKVDSGDPSIAPEGWVSKGLDYVIVLSPEGECVQLDQRFSLEKGKIVSKSEFLPAIGKQAMKHTNSGKDANLLWDNASFVFGRGNKGDIKLGSFAKTFTEWLSDCNDEGIRALSSFYGKMRENADLISLLLERYGCSEDFEKRDPILAFQLLGDKCLLHFRSAIKECIEERMANESSGVLGTCLITGKRGVPIAMNETVIKGVWGGQTSGTNLISFNERAFESYGKTKRAGENAPVSKQASFSYTTALNYLLGKDSTQRMQVGDASTVFWAEKPSSLETAAPDIFGESPKDDPDRHVRAVEQLFASIRNGRYIADDQDTRFYVLGLAPNAARIAVRFWHVGTVGEMAERIVQHFEDLKIVHGPKEAEYLSLFRLLVSTASLGKADNIPPNLAGDTMRAIIEGLPYPQTLLGAAIRRIKAEQLASYPRAALIKACINRATRYLNAEIKEELKVSLDENNANIGYRLGRLFAVLEKIQEEANPGLNATIRDRYYGSASSSPVTVFSTLLKLSKHHLSKLHKGRAVNIERQIGEIMSEIQDFPAHLSIADQGRFAIGYYHQRQHLFTKSTNNEEMNHD